ncbi:hypothetical protein R69608_03222 [Paraburkholderia nemoris]|nr:hypothetical protein R69608_03222 [Paraburkholderia nemoris]
MIDGALKDFYQAWSDALTRRDGVSAVRGHAVESGLLVQEVA